MLDVSTDDPPQLRRALIFPDPPPVDAARVVDFMGAGWVAVSGDLDVLNLRAAGSGARPAGPEFDVAILGFDTDPEGAAAVLSALVRKRGIADTIIALVRGNQLHDLPPLTPHISDFCVTPFHPAELEARLRLAVAFRAAEASPVPSPTIASDNSLLVYEDLVLNLETYQAQVADRSLDLTYMEYELLHFLVASPGKVFSREILLSQVWGYEYFGGARTVDVHIRRLRSKLGEEHARLIQTVRSVGYRFGESSWGSETGS